MKKYTVVVPELMPRCCTVEIPAESAEGAVAESESIWGNGEPGNNMVNSEVSGPDLVGAYIFN